MYYILYYKISDDSQFNGAIFNFRFETYEECKKDIAKIKEKKDVVKYVILTELYEIIEFNDEELVNEVMIQINNF